MITMSKRQKESKPQFTNAEKLQINIVNDVQID